MEKVIEGKNEIIKDKEDIVENKKKSFKIFGYSLWRIFAYFIIYSVIGFIIETLYGIVESGVIESRKSFLYGPFCAIYGLGAIIMILGLNYFKKNKYYVFIGGFLLGSIVEYLISFFGELIYKVKWWDYTTMPININGRVCIYFSILWGVLALILIKYINPRVDKVLDKIKENKKVSTKVLKIILIIMIVFLAFDFIISGYAMNMFILRKVHDYNLDVPNKEEYDKQYDEVYSDKIRTSIIDFFFNDRIIIKAFPNIKIKSNSGEIIFFNKLVDESITPYFYKFKTNIFK